MMNFQFLPPVDPTKLLIAISSLPDRQLRSDQHGADEGGSSSLPDRQLRRTARHLRIINRGSLPDRQLRSNGITS